MQKTTITPPAMTSINNITITAPSAATIGIMEDDDGEIVLPENFSAVVDSNDFELIVVVCELVSLSPLMGTVLKFDELLEVGISVGTDVVGIIAVSSIDDDISLEIGFVNKGVKVDIAIVVVDIVVVVVVAANMKQ